MEGWLTGGDGVFAEKFKLVVCRFGLEGRGGRRRGRGGGGR